MNRIRWPVFMVLFVFMLMPNVAFASELNDSFSRGLNDLLGNGQVVEIKPESEFIESYEPQQVILSAPPAREYDEDSTTVDYVNGTLDEFNKVPWGAASFSFLDAIRFGILNNQLVLPAAVGLVFLWWGVRKSIKMLFAAFRKGNMNV